MCEGGSETRTETLQLNHPYTEKDGKTSPNSSTCRCAEKFTLPIWRGDREGNLLKHLAHETRVLEEIPTVREALNERQTGSKYLCFVSLRLSKAAQ